MKISGKYREFLYSSRFLIMISMIQHIESQVWSVSSLLSFWFFSSFSFFKVQKIASFSKKIVHFWFHVVSEISQVFFSNKLFMAFDFIPQDITCQCRSTSIVTRFIFHSTPWENLRNLKLSNQLSTNFGENKHVWHNSRCVRLHQIIPPS